MADPTPKFILSFTDHEGVTVVRFNAPQFGEWDEKKSLELRDAMRAAGASRVVFDLLDVPYLSSGFIGALVQAGRWCRSRGGNLVLRHVAPLICELLSPLPSKQQIHPEGCPFFVAMDDGEAETWLKWNPGNSSG